MYIYRLGTSLRLKTSKKKIKKKKKLVNLTYEIAEVESREVMRPSSTTLKR